MLEQNFYPNPRMSDPEDNINFYWYRTNGEHQNMHPHLTDGIFPIDQRMIRPPKNGRYVDGSISLVISGLSKE